MNYKKISGSLLTITMLINFLVVMVYGNMVEPFNTMYKFLGFFALTIILYDYFIKK